MKEDFFKIVGIIIVVGVLIYLAVKSMKLQTSIIEGLVNPSSTTMTSSQDALAENKASGAEAYAIEIQKLYAKNTDNMLIKDNRTSYENVIVQMDDFINSLMLQRIMSINKTELTEDNLISNLEKINILNQGKQSLNSVMKFIDGL
jgi:hypothetical protein